MVKVSVIGVGMRSHAGVAQQMFQTLADKGINIQVISTSEIKVSVLIAAEYTELALRAPAYRLWPRRRLNGDQRAGAALAHLDRLWLRGRVPRLRLCDHGRRHDLGVGAPSGLRHLQRRRLRRDRLRAR